MNRTAAFDAIVAATRDILELPEDRAISEDDSLKDLGANSVDRADILTDAMESLGAWTSLVEFGGARNIGDIVDVLANGGGKA